MLIFEITINKYAHPPKGSRPYFDSSAPHIGKVMQPKQRLVLWNKAKPMLITYWEEKANLASDRMPSRSFSSLQKWKANPIFTIELIIGDTVYTGCHATTRKITDCKLLPRYIYDILTQISNDFQWSLCRFQCRQTLAGTTRQLLRPVNTRSKPSLVPQTFSSFFFLSAMSIFLSLSSANVCHLHWGLSLASWVETHLTADWLQVCFGIRPDSVSKIFFFAFLKKIHTPPLMNSL